MTCKGPIDPLTFAIDIYYDLNWITTFTISTGWITQVANIPERPPITKGWTPSKNLSNPLF
jgi:hypothetical protein